MADRRSYADRIRAHEAAIERLDDDRRRRAERGSRQLRDALFALADRHSGIAA